MMLTCRYRVLPTKRQHRALEGMLEGQRQLYNAALEERIDAYRKQGITRTYFDQFKALTEWRQSDPEGASVPANMQRWTLKRLDDAYRAFFRRVKFGEGKPGFPRFRGKGRFDTFGFREFSGITLKDGRIRFKGMPGSLRVHLHRPLPDGVLIRTCVFRREIRGWIVGLVVSEDEASPRRALARKMRGSHRRRHARLEVARCHAAVSRRRADHLHQASARLVRDYDLIVIEKLNVKGLCQSVLAKDVHDAAWAKFISMLRYKAECAGARLIEVDPWRTAPRVRAMRTHDRSGPERSTKHPEPGRSGSGPAERSRSRHACRRKPR
jgi:putative transposase